MKLISWNVNGLRACVQKGFLERFHELDADFFCLQETKLQEGQIELSLPGYEQYWCCAQKKGYSGTAIFTKHTPTQVSRGIGVPELDDEGRVITLEYPEFFLVNCYTPNAQRGLARLEHRMRWDEAFRSYISVLDQKKPVIICGDLNVAHQEIDLKNPKSNRGNAGFSDEERSSFTATLACGFTDTFRHLHPDRADAYTWWSYMFHARENNAGWRIDYFLVSDRIRDSVYKTPIYSDIMGSDHCPVGLELDILCNGGIWSPDSVGKAKLISPEEKPAISPAVKKIIPCVLIFALLCAGLLIPKSRQNTNPSETTTPESSDIYKQPLVINTNLVCSSTAITADSGWTVYEYTEPLYSTTGIPSFTDGTYTWILGNVESDTLPDDVEPNFWLRLSMSESMRNDYDGQWHPDPNAFTALSSVNFHNTAGFVVQQYYNPEDLQKISGWYVYGYLPPFYSLFIKNSITGNPIYTVSPTPAENPE